MSKDEPVERLLDLEARERGGLVVEAVEDRHELRDGQQIFEALGEVQELQRAAGILRRRIRVNEMAEADDEDVAPLPGLAPGFSDLCLIANASGMEYRSLIGEILASALRRMRERKAPARS